MNGATPPGAAAGEPPRPDDATSLDELTVRLNALRAWVGLSYRELHRRLVRRRRSRGMVEEPAYATVYRCLQPGRRRLDIDLVVDIVAVLTDDEVEAARWRQAYAQVSGEATATAYATVLDTLPEDPGEFTGRDDELAMLLERLDRSTDADESATVLVIDGMAGVGKTTLAVRVARRVLERRGRADAVLAVNLCGHDPERAPVDPMAVLDGFLRQLGEPGPRIQSLDLTQRRTRFRELLAARPSLVLLDNAASEDQIDPLLPDHPAALVLVTSRHRVVRRPTAHHLALEVFTSEQALDLLRKRAADTVDAAPDVAARIVDQVGRLPLAVALVAARIEASSGWTLEDHLDQLLERRDAMRLDPGVELAFMTSYEALPPSRRRMLRLLALHPGRDCDAYAAAALAGIELDAAGRQLADLVEGSLVSSRVAGRYELHDLVRIFAANRARDEDAPSARRAALTRLLDHYRWAATIAMDAYAPAERARRPQVPASGTAVPPVPDRRIADEWLEIERPNLIALGMHAAEHGWAEHVGDLSAGLARYLLTAAHYDEAARLHGLASRVAPEGSKSVALKNLAVARWHQGNRAEARARLVDALDIARSTGDRVNEARALNDLGVVYHHMGRGIDASHALDQALEIYAAIRDRVGEARARQNLGTTLRAMGDRDRALDMLGRAWAGSRSVGDLGGVAVSLENLGRLLNQMGRHTEAREHEVRAIAITRQTRDRVTLADALTGLGTAYAGWGNLKMAARHQRHALSIANEIGSQASKIYGHNELGITLRQQGAFAESLAHHQKALIIAKEVDDLQGQASAHDELARDHTSLGDLECARSHLEQALDLFSIAGPSRAAEVQSRINALDAERIEHRRERGQ